MNHHNSEDTNTIGENTFSFAGILCAITIQDVGTLIAICVAASALVLNVLKILKTLKEEDHKGKNLWSVIKEMFRFKRR